MPAVTRKLFASVLLLIVTAAIAAAQGTADTTRRLTALRLEPDERIAIDGRLSEDAWTRAQAATDFRQQDPLTGNPATEPTEVRVVYDAKRIVIGVRCF